MAVLVEQAEGVGVAEILPLQQRLGIGLLDGLDELLDEGVVFRAAHALLVESDIQRVFVQLGVVGADVQGDGQAVVGMQAGASRIERELADGNAHAERAQVTEAEDALAIGHHDHAHIRMRPVAQNLRDPAALADADENAAGPAEDGAVFEAGLADRGGVDDGDHLLRMLLHQPVEKGLVAVLQGGEEDVLLERIRFAAVIAVDAMQLLLDREHPGRQQAAQAQRIALALGEGRTLVEQRIGQQSMTPRVGRASMWIEAFIG